MTKLVYKLPINILSHYLHVTVVYPVRFLVIYFRHILYGIFVRDSYRLRMVSGSPGHHNCDPVSTLLTKIMFYCMAFALHQLHVSNNTTHFHY